MQANITLPPNLAHQVIWNRFVNVKGGAGKNIPCDLFNEHVNKQLKTTICNMGSNLTETALQRAARSVTCLHNLCTNFDKQSGVPYRTSAHSTKSDLPDVKKVVNVVLNRKLLTNISSRGHRKFPNMGLDPLHKWDVQRTLKWIQGKKKDYMKYRDSFHAAGADPSDFENPYSD